MELLSDDDFDSVVEDLKQWPNAGIEPPSRPGAEWVVGLTASIYFRVTAKETALRARGAVKLMRSFQALLGNKLTHEMNPASEKWLPIGHSTLPDLEELAGRSREDDQSFFLGMSSSDNARSGPDFAFSSKVNHFEQDDHFALSYISINMNFRWWRQNKDMIRQWLLSAATELHAEQGYFGFSVLNPLDIGCIPDYEEFERALARRFFGLDIDKPFFMTGPWPEKHPLCYGTRSPAWGTFIGGRWLEKVGGLQSLRAQLTHPDIKLYEYEGGIFIEVGDEPALLPVEQGIPRVYGQIAKVLKPARAEELRLISFGEWDDDPAQRFTLAESRRWLARFDDDGDWPSKEVRFWQSDDGHGAETGGDVPRLRCAANHFCPKEGYWFTPAKADSRRHFKQDETMPDLGTAGGPTIWQWDENQEG